MAVTMINGFTLAEAKEQLELWKTCAKEIASAPAKRYKIGSREYEAFDLPEVYRMIKYFADLVDEMSGTNRQARVQVVVPRD